MLCTCVSAASANFPPPPPSITEIPSSLGLLPSRDPSSLILRPTHGELEHDPLTRQFPIDLGVGVEPKIDAAALLLVQDDLEHLAAVLTGAGAFADNFDGVDDVVENGVVDGGQCARVRPFLRLRCPRSIATFGPGENAARCQEEDVSVRELLLEFSRQAVSRRKEAVVLVRLRSEVGWVGASGRIVTGGKLGRNTAVGLCESLTGEELERR